MIDNERIEQRKEKKKRRRKASVVLQAILILLAILAILYGLFLLHPEWTNGKFVRFVPTSLREQFFPDTDAALTEAEPTRLPTPTPSPTPEPSETPTATPTPEPTPTIDPAIAALQLPSYEQYELSDWNLILVNADHPIPDDYHFNLIYLDEDNEFLVDPRIADALLNMLADCRAAGCTPLICSAYRDPETQSYLFEEEEEGEEDIASAEASVALPGSSEHEIGLAVDLYSEENTELDETQEDTETQQWLMQHAWEYGFILRYPKDKEKQTGIVYEPWHYRYVEKDVARDIYEKNLCLEEYLENMKKVKEALPT